MGVKFVQMYNMTYFICTYIHILISKITKIKLLFTSM